MAALGAARSRGARCGAARRSAREDLTRGGAARGCVIRGGPAHVGAAHGGQARDDDRAQVSASAAMPVVVAVDLSVGRRLRAADEREVVKTEVSTHVGSARSPALVCSSAQSECAVTVCCSASRFAARAREGWQRAGEESVHAPVTVRGSAPSTGCCADWAANIVVGRAGSGR
jgi:hypothetical protein